MQLFSTLLFFLWKALIPILYNCCFSFFNFQSLLCSLSVGIQVHNVSCFEICFQYRGQSHCREIHAACFLNLYTKDRPKFSRGHSIGQPNMIQRDKNIRGVLLERLLGIPFHHHMLKIFLLYLRIVLLAETFKQHFYGTKHLCYLYIVL